MVKSLGVICEQLREYWTIRNSDVITSWERQNKVQKFQKKSY